MSLTRGTRPSAIMLVSDRFYRSATLYCKSRWRFETAAILSLSFLQVSYALLQKPLALRNSRGRKGAFAGEPHERRGNRWAKVETFCPLRR